MLRRCRLTPTACRDRCTRQIVGRGAEAAGRDHDVDPFDGRLEDRDVVSEAVADRGVERHVDAEFGESFGEPLRVRIEALAGDDLVADGDNFCTHRQNSPSCLRESYGLRTRLR